MSLLSFLLTILAAVVFTVMGRKEKGPLRYKGIRWFWRKKRKEGWEKPSWFREKEIFSIWLFMCVGSAVLMSVQIVEHMQDGQINTLKRPVWNEGYSQEDLILEWKDEDGRVDTDRITVDVGQKKPSGRELEKILTDAKQKIDVFIEKQISPDGKADRCLELPERLDGSPVTISWDTDKPQVMDYFGTIGEKISENGERVCLIAEITILDAVEEYRKYITVFPENLTKEEELARYLDQQSEPGEKDMILPDSIQGEQLIWKKNTGRIRNIAQTMLILCPILAIWGKKKKEEEKEKKEKQQMMLDYPEILTKLTLLLNTGVNVRKAMERIGKDYETFRKKGEQHKAYQLILEACGEMDRGVSEKDAYEHIGEKSGLLCYRTMSSLLIQHLQKGSRGMEKTLEEEVIKAQTERQQQARVLGEQASTKLLIPMVLMLLIVFVILIVPAWIAFI